MRVLVTGGAGFIGANLVRRLLDSTDFVVTVLDDLSATNGGNVPDGDARVTFARGDIRDVHLLDQIVPGHDAIVHLAAQAGVPASLQDPVRDFEINALGTLRMLEAARGAGVSRFLFASSSAPLGRQEPPATEDKAPLPMSPYGAAKLAGEGYCLAYSGSWGLGTVALRFANVYGELSGHKKSVVSTFFRDAATKGRLTIEGGRQTRDLIYVGDVCEAIMSALGNDVRGEVFQIGTGVETTIIRLAELIREITGGGAEIVEGSTRRGDVGRSYSSIDKARAVLGWEPSTSLEEGLRRTWSWMREHDTFLAERSGEVGRS